MPHLTSIRQYFTADCYFLSAAGFFAANGTPAIFFTRHLSPLLGEEPQRLVRSGPYRYSRNPMYIGVLATVLGWSIIAGSPLMAAYAATIAIAFHLRVIFYEEPTLARKFGDEWTRYFNRVNRWWPELSPDKNLK